MHSSKIFKFALYSAAVLLALGSTAMAAPIDAGSCLICTTVVPDCGPCASGEICYTPQTCDSCAKCLDTTPAPETCVSCTMMLAKPNCVGGCGADETCVVENTCNACNVSRCIPKKVPEPKNCVLCTMQMVEANCVGGCAADEMCTVRNTCDACHVSECAPLGSQ